MKKMFSLILTLIMVIGVLTGCSGTPIIYHDDCTCPGVNNGSDGETEFVPTEGALKTGLAIVTSISGSENAKHADYDVTIVAVTVDDAGVIQDCIIDSIGTKVTFDASGTITSDLTAEILTKNELGDAYGMKQYGGSKYEWYEQAEALANYAVGKTVDELKNGAIDESGKAPAGSDLASTATIYLGGYVSAIETAVNNAKHLGAQSGDELRLAAIPTIGSSAGATAEKAGTAQLDVDVTAVTVKDGKITGCYIDSLQAKVSFKADGSITTDLTSPVKTKNELGYDYNMKTYGGAKYEWFEQAASFAKYVTGKTAAEVAGIAVSEGKPSDADLSASVTISIGGFQNLIAKVMK